MKKGSTKPAQAPPMMNKAFVNGEKEREGESQGGTSASNSVSVTAGSSQSRLNNGGCV